MTQPPNDSDRTQYIDAATRQAFVVDDDSVEDGGRAIVHCFSGSLGADWDLEAVVKAIELAESVCWTDTLAAKILGHPLEVVTTDGRTLLFQVRRTDS